MSQRTGIIGALSGSAAVAIAGLPQVVALGALSVTALGHAALASGVVAAFVATVFGRLCASLVSRAPGEISTPLASTTIIYASLCADLLLRGGSSLTTSQVIAGLSLAVVMTGALQLLAGWARLGEALKFLPYPVNAGFLTGIGLLVVWAQLGPAIGLEGRLTRYHWAEIVDQFKPAALLVATVSATAVWFAPRITRRLPSLLFGLIAGTATYYLFGLFVTPASPGPVIGVVTPLSTAVERVVDAWRHLDPLWLVDMSIRVLPYAGLLALEGSLEMAITSRDVTAVTGVRPDVHRGLVAQGIANIVSGMLAGLPIAPSHSQSLAAARTGASAAWVPGLSAFLLLAGLMVFAGLLSYFPTAVLAGLLVTVGISTIDHWTRGLVVQVVQDRGQRREILLNLAMVIVVSGAFFFGGVPLALLVGTVLAMVVLARNLAAATNFTPRDGRHYSSTRIWPTPQARWLVEGRAAIRVLRPRGGLFFGTAELLAEQLALLKPPVKYCIIDCARLTVLDATGCKILADGARQLARQGITTVLAGLDPTDPRDRDLVALGLNAPAADEHWFRDLDLALETVESELLQEQWPGVVAHEPVGIAANELAIGLTASELETLQSRLTVTEYDQGAVLFERGTESSALYVIERGLIEIRIASAEADRHRHRLAVFGPGCLFGEISMLTGMPRSAGAECVTPVRVHILSRAALQDLQAQFPTLYGKLIANLSLHLATRLVQTTDIVQRK